MTETGKTSWWCLHCARPLEAYADAMHLKAHQERPEERRGRESNSQTLKGPRG